LVHFGRVDERKAEGDALDPSLAIGMPDVCQEAAAIEDFSDSRLQYLVGPCRAWIIGNDDQAYLPRRMWCDPFCSSWARTSNAWSLAFWTGSPRTGLSEIVDVGGADGLAWQKRGFCSVSARNRW